MNFFTVAITTALVSSGAYISLQSFDAEGFKQKAFQEKEQNPNRHLQTIPTKKPITQSSLETRSDFSASKRPATFQLASHGIPDSSRDLKSKFQEFPLHQNQKTKQAHGSELSHNTLAKSSRSPGSDTNLQQEGIVEEDEEKITPKDLKPLNLYDFEIEYIQFGLDKNAKPNPEAINLSSLLNRINRAPEWDIANNDRNEDRLNQRVQSQLISLGLGGSIVLRVSTGFIKNASGDDFVVFENPFFIKDQNKNFEEPANVYVSAGKKENGTYVPSQWVYVGQAGKELVYLNQPVTSEQSGGDRFDLDDCANCPEKIRFVKIVDSQPTPKPQKNPGGATFGGVSTQTKSHWDAGFDLDSFAILHGDSEKK